MSRAPAVLFAAALACGLSACGAGGSSGRTPLAVGCTSGSSYSGARAGDCVAGTAHRFIVAVDGYEVLVGNWKRVTDDAGRHLICAGVNVEDVATSPVPVRPSQFSLTPPGGRARAAAAAATNGLVAAALGPSQQEGGTICWSDPGTAGQYVAAFNPPVRSPHRGIWLIRFVAR